MKNIENAKWIKHPLVYVDRVIEFSKNFAANGAVASATLEITSLGIYEAKINPAGRLITNVCRLIPMTLRIWSRQITIFRSALLPVGEATIWLSRSITAAITSVQKRLL